MSEFLEEGYEIPKAPSNYTKIEKDVTLRLRVLPSWNDTDVIRCYEYFDIRWEKPKPVRSLTPFKETPWIKDKEKQKEVWNLKVWNYKLEQIQIYNIPQITIKEQIMKYFQDEDFLSPINYDLKITKTWEWFDTKYAVLASPPKAFDSKLLEWKDVDIDWSWFLECETDIFKAVEA